MDSAAWIALITMLVQSGVLEKLVNLIVSIFDQLTPETKAEVSNKLAKLALKSSTSAEVV